MADGAGAPAAGELLGSPNGDAALVALAERLQAVCIDRRLTVALAESCTGGLVAAALTAVPGSSGYVLGGIVSYSDEVKRDVLGVDAELLAAHGAVSAQVARAMAVGARERLGADLAGSVTGIAGPDGGSDAKPVGLTYVGAADGHGVDVRRFVWPGDRAENRRDSAIAVLELLLERAVAIEPAGDGASARAPGDEAIRADAPAT
jgi:PncC family amidohydrolase